eukprot:jgi/Mesen1/2004/ME000147S01101
MINLVLYDPDLGHERTYIAVVASLLCLACLILGGQFVRHSFPVLKKAGAHASPIAIRKQRKSSDLIASSMMEQLVPEVTHHALSYLDFRSLCSLSMTNSVMRQAANDDAAWQTLFKKDFTGEQEGLRPPQGWKQHYAETKAVQEVNQSFYTYFGANSFRHMRQLWLRQNYVSCMHPGSTAKFGYDAVMESWRLIFGWDLRYNCQIQDVRVRVMGDMAWVTCKEYVNARMSEMPLLATNAYERHGGEWYMVHHHTSPQIVPP